MRLIFPLLCILLVLACHKEVSPSVSIEAELKPYFERFALAGELRGVQVNFGQEGIEGVFDAIAGGANGQCQHRSGAPNLVVVDRDYWVQATDLEREFLIFHELGHCFLNRSHDDAKTNAGVCLSMMHSTSTICRNTYNGMNREAFWDELFANR